MADVGREELKGLVREGARDFRRIALEIDKDPDKIVDHLDLEGVRWMTYMYIPGQYAPTAESARGARRFFVKCSERVVVMENLAYGDVGVLLASPGSALSGPLVEDMGSDEHKEMYFTTLLSRPTWTFFALSEPERGTDAANLSTSLTPDPTDASVWRLNGQKYFIGNGARASLGVVFARRSPGPLGIEIAFVRPPQEGFRATSVPTLGMRAGGLSHLFFENCRIEKRDLLGSHLNPSKRGLWGAIRTFNRMRPGLAAMALGVAQATYDYILENRRTFNEREKSRLESFARSLLSVRSSVMAAAEEADRDASLGVLASIAKIRSVELVETITESALDFFGPGLMLEHPFLNKWYRDARGFEYMEGTSNILRLKVGQAFATGKLDYE